ncbi:MAG: penicillin-binding protein 2 [Chloroflexota bacterium]|nr:penicillin-binding protein 2 [Chloroflexota bacterium]
MTKSIRQVAAIIVLCFVVVSLDLVYWQVWRAPDLATRAGNPRAIEARQEIQRGMILDRHGAVLAKSVRSGNAFKRQYALASLSPLIGYSSVRFGQDGLEKSFNNQLEGSTGDLAAALTNSLLQQPRVGDTLTLSIDAKLQQAADQALGNVSGAAILMKPKTGEILALVTKPYFNANELDQELPRHQNDPSGPFFNRATLGLFPPGSTFKMVTASAALGSGTATPATRFQARSDTFVVDGFPIRGRNLPAGLTEASLTEAFQYSCNTCFAQLGLQLGWPKLQDYAERFNLDKPIPFDLPVRTSHLHQPGVQLSRLLLANTAYGQGQLAVTPMQMLLIGAAIANNGLLPQPHVVMKESSPAGQPVSDYGGGSLGLAVNPDVAGEVKQMMVDVVNKGSGVLARVPNVQVAGKTGTAETGDGKPPHAWFVAFAPANDPRYAVVVIREHQGEGYDQAAPMAKTILQAALASND